MDFLLRLPADLARRVILFLSVPQRLRCREVSKAWRSGPLASPLVWRVLDVSAAAVQPFLRPPRSPEERFKGKGRLDLLVAASSKAACGAAEEIDFSGHTAFLWPEERTELGYSAFSSKPRGAVPPLLAAVRDNAESLRVLRLCGTAPLAPAEAPSDYLKVTDLQCAAPHLEVLEADLLCRNAAWVKRLLGYGPGGVAASVTADVRVGTLVLEAAVGSRDGNALAAVVAAFNSLSAGDRNHLGLRGIEFYCSAARTLGGYGGTGGSAPELAALADAVGRCKLESLCIHDAPSVPSLLRALTRALLAEGRPLRSLKLMSFEALLNCEDCADEGIFEPQDYSDGDDEFGAQRRLFGPPAL